jgi:hypothetical protein
VRCSRRRRSCGAYGVAGHAVLQDVEGGHALPPGGAAIHGPPARMPCRRGPPVRVPCRWAPRPGALSMGPAGPELRRRGPPLRMPCRRPTRRSNSRPPRELVGTPCAARRLGAEPISAATCAGRRRPIAAPCAPVDARLPDRSAPRPAQPRIPTAPHPTHHTTRSRPGCQPHPQHRDHQATETDPPHLSAGPLRVEARTRPAVGRAAGDVVVRAPRAPPVSACRPPPQGTEPCPLGVPLVDASALQAAAQGPAADEGDGRGADAREAADQ